MSDHKDAPPATEKVQRAEPSLADLIAQTPGAQTREQALKHIASREKEFSPRKRQRPAPSDDEVAKHEPMPIHDNPLKDNPYQWAIDHLKRKQPEARTQQRPPKGFKPYLVPKKDKPDPADKK
jgi:hypothetical protein